MRVDVRRFLEFWHTGIGMHIIHVSIYYVTLKLYKLKVLSVLLIMSVVAFVFSIIFLDFERPTSGMFGDVGYSMAYNFLFSMIMLITFAVTVFMIEEHTSWKYRSKHVISLASSFLLGGGISYIVWLALFRLYHG